MATAHQLTTTSGTLVAAATNFRTVDVQNLGPEPIYVDRSGADATTTDAVRVNPGGFYSFGLRPNVAVTGRVETTTQVAPDDTRVEVTEL